MTGKYPQPILDAGMKALRSYLPGEHEEDPRMVQAIFEAMEKAREELEGTNYPYRTLISTDPGTTAPSFDLEEKE